MTKKRYIIDSLNLLNDLVEAKELLNEGGLDVALEWLTSWASPVHDDLGHEVHLVVDGKGAQVNQVFPRKNDQQLSVLFSPSHLTADGVIERWVVAMDDPERVVLVSNDRAIQHAVLARGGDIMSPKTFAEELDRLNARRVRALKKNRKDLDGKWGSPFDDLVL